MIFAATTLCLLVCFVMLASFRIWLPGIYYDEALFVNAARGGEDDSFIHLRVAGLPVMLMPYLGALKAWLYTPVFRWLGVSPVSIRLPGILIASAALLLWTLALRKLVGIRYALLFLALEVVDPGFMIQSRLDWGPTVLMGFFKACLFFIFASAIQRPLLWHIFAAIAALALGFFDKLSFIWIPVAALVCIPIAFADEAVGVFSSPGMRRRLLIGIVGLGFMLVGAWRVVHTLLVFPSFADIVARMPGIYRGSIDTIGGHAVANFIAPGVPFPGAVWHYLLPALGVFCLTVLIAGFRNKREIGTYRLLPNVLLFLLLFQVILFLEFCVTSQAGGAHHFIMLAQLPVASLVIAIALVRVVKSHIVSLLLRAFGMTIVAALLSCSVCATVAFCRMFADSDTRYNHLWSDGIYDLAACVSARGEEYESIRCVDWGIYNNLRSLLPQHIRNRMNNLDLWPCFSDFGSTKSQQIVQKAAFLVPQGRHLYVVHPETCLSFPSTRKAFFTACQMVGVQPQRIPLPERSSMNCYELYSVSTSLVPDGK